MKTLVSVSAVVSSPIGGVRLVASGGVVRRIDLGVAATSLEEPDDPVLRETARQLAEYFDGRRRSFDVPIRFEGTPFQEEVWSALLEIPFGETRSYGDVARRIGRPRAVRAVGAANGANPIPILVPCHRVIGADGSLTGYGGGMATKRALLDLEGVRCPRSM